MLCGHVGDHADKLYLRVYADADFCGDSGHTRSNSGGFLALAGPNTFFPLAWICKRQTSTSRSTTEAEIVSLAASLFSEALPQVELWEKLLGRPFSCVFEQDNQATVLVSKAGYSPKLRYVNRTHKINVASIKECLERENMDIRYINTNLQVADVFTKQLTPDKLEMLCSL